MEEDHTAQFINALAHLQPVDTSGDGFGSLEGWSIDQLKAEVVRLRRALANAGHVQHQQQHHHGVPTPVSAVGPPSSLPPHHHGVQPPPPPHNVGVPVGGGVGGNVGVVQHVQDMSHLEPRMEPAQPDMPLHLPGYGYVQQLPQAQQHHPHHHQQHNHHHHQQQQHQQQHHHHQAPQLQEPPRKRSFTAEVMHPAPGTSRKRPSRHDSDTGKRVERGRRVELQRAVRAKMRYMMGIGLEEDLPPPSQGDVATVGWVPNWTAGVGDARNAEWLDRVVSIFINEATAYHQWNKVPAEDLEPETVKAATRTAFQNFAKRYLADVDPKQAKKQQKYVKNRRRWARKDLKRRAKAAQDPSFADIHLPPSALHIDYMSSEYSSAGEDDNEDEVAQRRNAHWMAMLRTRSPEDSMTGKSGKGGWAEGVSEKVLEVRTPTWRSARLDDMYRRLDTISAAQAALRATPAAQQAVTGKATSGTRLGHVAPSHQRFTMPPELMRRGHAPRDGGESWMWQSGYVGVWPEGQREELSVPTTSAGSEQSSATARDVMVAGGQDIDPNSVDAFVEGWAQVV